MSSNWLFYDNFIRIHTDISPFCSRKFLYTLETWMGRKILVKSRGTHGTYFQKKSIEREQQQKTVVHF